MTAYAKRNIFLIQLYTIGWNAMFLLPVILTYYKAQMGLGFQQFVLAEVFFSAVVMALEVPSGWVADIWGRKTALLIGVGFMFIGWAMLLIPHGGFWLAAGAQGVIGVGISLKSGTDTAFIFETLQAADQAHLSRAQIGLQRALSMYSCAVSALIGGVLYAWHPAAPLHATLICLVVSLMAALALDEPARHTAPVDQNPLRDIAVTIRETVIKKRDLGILMLGAALLFGSTKYVVWAQQAYWEEMHLAPSTKGLLFALGAGIGGLAGHYGHRIEHRFGYKKTFAAIWAGLCTAWLFAGVHLGWAGVWGLYLGSVSFCIGGPALEDAINQRVSSERRATVISTSSLLNNLIFLPVGSIASWVAEHHGVQNSLLTLSGFHIAMGLIGAALWLRFRPRRR